MKIKIMIGGLMVIGFMWLAIGIAWAFNASVTRVEPIFYQTPSQTQILVPHGLSPKTQINRLFGKDAKVAYAIFMAESHLRADAVSPTGDIGCAQINHKAHPQYAVSDLLDCNKNIRIAYEIYSHQGNFSAWSTYNNGSYLKYLTN